MKKIVSLLLLVSFFMTNISFACDIQLNSSPEIYHLAPPLASGNITEGTNHEKYMTLVTMMLEMSLKKLDILTNGGISSASNPEEIEKVIRNRLGRLEEYTEGHRPAKIRIFFNMMERLSLNAGGTIFSVPASVTKDGKTEEYWVTFIARKDASGEFPMVPYPKKEFESKKESLLQHARLGNLSPQDPKALSARKDYAEHEIYDREVIKWAHDQGLTVRLERNSGEFLTLLHTIASSARLDVDRLKYDMEGVEIYLVPLTPEVDRRMKLYTVNVEDMNGNRQRVPAYAHASKNAIHIFVPENYFNTTRDRIDFHNVNALHYVSYLCAHEVYNLPILYFAGNKPINEIDERIGDILKGKKVEVKVFARGNRDNIVGRDYAADNPSIPPKPETAKPATKAPSLPSIAELMRLLASDDPNMYSRAITMLSKLDMWRQLTPESVIPARLPKILQNLDNALNDMENPELSFNAALIFASPAFEKHLKGADRALAVGVLKGAIESNGNPEKVGKAKVVLSSLGEPIPDIVWSIPVTDDVVRIVNTALPLAMMANKEGIKPDPLDMATFVVRPIFKDRTHNRGTPSIVKVVLEGNRARIDDKPILSHVYMAIKKVLAGSGKKIHVAVFTGKVSGYTFGKKLSRLTGKIVVYSVISRDYKGLVIDEGLFEYDPNTKEVQHITGTGGGGILLRASGNDNQSKIPDWVYDAIKGRIKPDSGTILAITIVGPNRFSVFSRNKAGKEKEEGIFEANPATKKVDKDITREFLEKISLDWIRSYKLDEKTDDLLFALIKEAIGKGRGMYTLFDLITFMMENPKEFAARFAEKERLYLFARIGYVLHSSKIFGIDGMDEPESRPSYRLILLRYLIRNKELTKLLPMEVLMGCAYDAATSLDIPVWAMVMNVTSCYGKIANLGVIFDKLHDGTPIENVFYGLRKNNGLTYQESADLQTTILYLAPEYTPKWPKRFKSDEYEWTRGMEGAEVVKTDGSGHTVSKNFETGQWPQQKNEPKDDESAQPRGAGGKFGKKRGGSPEDALTLIKATPELSEKPFTAGRYFEIYNANRGRFNFQEITLGTARNDLNELHKRGDLSRDDSKEPYEFTFIRKTMPDVVAIVPLSGSPTRGLARPGDGDGLLNSTSLVRMAHSDSPIPEALANTGAFDDRKGAAEALRAVATSRDPNTVGTNATAIVLSMREAGMPASDQLAVVASVAARSNTKLAPVVHDLLMDMDSSLAMNLQGLFSKDPNVQEASFGWLFSRLIIETEEIFYGAKDKESMATRAYIADIILRQINLILSETDENKWENLRRNIIVTFAKRIRLELLGEAKSSISEFMQKDSEIAKKFIYSAHRNFAMFSNWYKRPGFAGRPGTDCEAVENLLSLGCILWPGESFDDIMLYYDKADNYTKIHYLWSMAYSIRKNNRIKVGGDINDAGLSKRQRFILENAILMAGSDDIRVPPKCRDILETIPELFINYLFEGKRYQSLSKKVRGELIDVILNIVIGSDGISPIRGGRSRVLALIIYEMSLENNIGIQKKILMHKGNYFDDGLLDSLSEEDQRVLQVCMSENFANEENVIIADVRDRILARFGFPSISAFFDSFKAKNLRADMSAYDDLLLSAKAASSYTPVDDTERGEIQRMAQDVTAATIKSLRDKRKAVEGFASIFADPGQKGQEINRLIEQLKETLAKAKPMLEIYITAKKLDGEEAGIREEYKAFARGLQVQSDSRELKKIRKKLADLDRRSLEIRKEKSSMDQAKLAESRRSVPELAKKAEELRGRILKLTGKEGKAQEKIDPAGFAEIARKAEMLCHAARLFIGSPSIPPDQLKKYYNDFRELALQDDQAAIICLSIASNKNFRDMTLVMEAKSFAAKQLLEGPVDIGGIYKRSNRELAAYIEVLWDKGELLPQGKNDPILTALCLIMRQRVPSPTLTSTVAQSAARMEDIERGKDSAIFDIAMKVLEEPPNGIGLNKDSILVSLKAFLTYKLRKEKSAASYQPVVDSIIANFEKMAGDQGTERDERTKLANAMAQFLHNCNSLLNLKPEPNESKDGGSIVVLERTYKKYLEIIGNAQAEIDEAGKEENGPNKKAPSAISTFETNRDNDRALLLLGSLFARNAVPGEIKRIAGQYLLSLLTKWTNVWLTGDEGKFSISPVAALKGMKLFFDSASLKVTNSNIDALKHTVSFYNAFADKSSIGAHRLALSDIVIVIAILERLGELISEEVTLEIKPGFKFNLLNKVKGSLEECRRRKIELESEKGTKDITDLRLPTGAEPEAPKVMPSIAAITTAEEEAIVVGDDTHSFIVLSGKEKTDVIGLYMQAVGKDLKDLPKGIEDEFGVHEITKGEEYAIFGKGFVLLGNLRKNPDNTWRFIPHVGEDKGSPGRDDVPVAGTTMSAGLYDLAPHPLVNALISMAIEYGVVSQMDEKNHIYWIGKSYQCGNLLDAFRLVMEKWKIATKTFGPESQIRFVEELVKRADIQNVIVDERYIEELEARLARQIEHFGVENGNVYIASGHFVIKDTILRHVGVERNIHLKAIEVVFGGDFGKYRQWRKGGDGVGSALSVKVYWEDPSTLHGHYMQGTMTYNQFAQMAHESAERLYPLSSQDKAYDASGKSPSFEVPTAGIATEEDTVKILENDDPKVLAALKEIRSKGHVVLLWDSNGFNFSGRSLNPDEAVEALAIGKIFATAYPEGSREASGIVKGVMFRTNEVTTPTAEEVLGRVAAGAASDAFEEVMATLPKEYNSALMDYETISSAMTMARVGGEEVNIGDKSALIFSNKITFECGFGVFLQKIAKSGIRVAVVATTNRQVELINELNEGIAEKDRKIEYGPTLEEAKSRLKGIPRFYYVKEEGEAEEPGLISISVAARKIIEALGKMHNIIDEKTIELMYKAAVAFKSAA